MGGQCGAICQRAKPETTRQNGVEAGVDTEKLLRKQLTKLLMDWLAALGYRFYRPRVATVDDGSLDRGPLRASI